MLIRAKSPLRLGFAGGGTDLSPYSDMYGGMVLNACVDMYAYTTIEETNSDVINIMCHDINERGVCDCKANLVLDGALDIIKGVHNYVLEKYNLPVKSYNIETFVDAPQGSGLGSSSALVVAIVSAFTNMYNIPLGEYDLAHLAYVIERDYLKLAGGKQDQYATAFGGFNFMEFYAENKVIVNPLRIHQDTINELNHNLVLFFTGTRRESAKIIEKQINATKTSIASLEATHNLKKQAVLMKEALLRGELYKMGEILNYGWVNKKATTDVVSNNQIDKIYAAALDSGSTGGKVSGAGGGGFMMFYCPNNTRYKVIQTLSKYEGFVAPFKFVKNGTQTWRVKL